MEPWRLAPGEGARVAVVGGADRMGAAIAAALVAAGAFVAVLDAPSVLAASPPRPPVRTIPLNAADPAAIAAALAGLADWRALDACVVLTGFTPTGHGADGYASDAWPTVAWQAEASRNLRRAFLVARGVLPLLRRGRDPALVLTGAGLETSARHAFVPHAAARSGVIALTRTLAMEAAPLVRVNCVAPGADRTDADMAYGQVATAPSAVADADAVTPPVLFLLGPASRHITGQVLHVNGGASPS